MNLSKIKLFLIDMDGTIYVDGAMIDGAMEALDHIRKSGKQLCFLTNNSSRSSAEYLEKLRKMGISADKNEIYTAGNATIAYLNENYAKKRVYLLGTRLLKQEFIQGGINLVNSNADVVVIGYDTELTYKKLCKATDFINCGATYICTHSDINCPHSPYFVPDVGSFIELIKASTGKKPEIVCGKPFKPMGDAVMKKFHLRPNEIAMVGDRLYTDIAFGNNNKFTSILVLSGETTSKMHICSDIKADYEINSISQLIKMI
ncbi:MAG: HAD-IIA family hydrolase [Clostridia bacterium]